MSLANTIFLWKKEMKELFRDKKALITIFLPMVLYPVIIAFIVGLTTIVQSGLDEKNSRIYFADEISSELLELFKQEEKLEIINKEIENFADKLKAEELDLAIEVNIENNIEIYTLYFNSTIERSERAKNRLWSVFRDYEEMMQERNIEINKIDYPIMELVEIEKIELAEDSQIAGMVLGMILPFLITLYSIIGVVTMSADLTAGEKERGTLETIFSTPMKKVDIIIGKLFAAMTVGMMSTLANLLALFPAVIFVMIQFPEFDVSVNPGIFVLTFLMLIPIMIIVSAIIIGVGFFANTYKEAQSYISPMLIIFMIPCYISIIPELEFTKILAFTPIANGVLVMRDGFMGRFSIENIIITVFINLLVAGISILFMTYTFKSEKIMFGIGEKKGKGFNIKKKKLGEHL